MFVCRLFCCCCWADAIFDYRQCSFCSCRPVIEDKESLQAHCHRCLIIWYYVFRTIFIYNWCCRSKVIFKFVVSLRKVLKSFVLKRYEAFSFGFNYSWWSPPRFSTWFQTFSNLIPSCGQSIMSIIIYLAFKFVLFKSVRCTILFRFGLF